MTTQPCVVLGGAPGPGPRGRPGLVGPHPAPARRARPGRGAGAALPAGRRRGRRGRGGGPGARVVLGSGAGGMSLHRSAAAVDRGAGRRRDPGRRRLDLVRPAGRGRSSPVSPRGSRPPTARPSCSRCAAPSTSRSGPTPIPAPSRRPTGSRAAAPCSPGSPTSPTWVATARSTWSARRAPRSALPSARCTQRLAPRYGAGRRRAGRGPRCRSGDPAGHELRRARGVGPRGAADLLRAGHARRATGRATRRTSTTAASRARSCNEEIYYFRIAGHDQVTPDRSGFGYHRTYTGPEHDAAGAARDRPAGRGARPRRGPGPARLPRSVRRRARLPHVLPERDGRARRPEPWRSATTRPTRGCGRRGPTPGSTPAAPSPRPPAG